VSDCSLGSRDVLTLESRVRLKYYELCVPMDYTLLLYTMLTREILYPSIHHCKLTYPYLMSLVLIGKVRISGTDDGRFLDFKFPDFDLILIFSTSKCSLLRMYHLEFCYPGYHCNARMYEF